MSSDVELECNVFNCYILAIKASLNNVKYNKNVINFTAIISLGMFFIMMACIPIGSRNGWINEKYLIVESITRSICSLFISNNSFK